MPRMSTPMRAWPGITLIAPGVTVSVPAVATVPAGSSLAARSIASTISAAPASASRRSTIETSPAWPDSPVTVISSRRGEATVVTTPSSRSSRRWATWTSAWARQRPTGGSIRGSSASRWR